jgi:RHS repeat-associated protein
VSPGAFSDDIDGIQAFEPDPSLMNTDNNYGYDQLGQLVRDDEEFIEVITWRIDGKISSILREDASGKCELSFVYDALGNRVAQKVYDDEGNWEKTTYYSLDAQGNVMAVYEYTEVESEPVLSFSEVHKYGSSRLGLRIPQGTPDLIGATDPEADETLSLERGHDRFELSNHLGNVLSIVSDRILPIEDGNTGIVAYHRPEVLTVMDYYPFGVMMEDRSYTDMESHRYGFQGQEMDDEIYGEGNALTFKYRVHDARLGRFLSVDPLAPDYPWNSPYAFSENRVSDAVELEGLESSFINPNGGLYNVAWGFQEFFSGVAHEIDQLGGQFSGWVSAMFPNGGTTSNAEGTSKLRVTASIDVGTNFVEAMTPTTDNKPSGEPFIFDFGIKTTLVNEVETTIPTAYGTLQTEVYHEYDTETGQSSYGTTTTFGLFDSGAFIENSTDGQGTNSVEVGLKGSVSTPEVFGVQLEFGAKASIKPENNE